MQAAVAVLISGQMRTADQCAAGIRAIYPDATFVVHAVADGDADAAFLFRPAVTVIEPQREMPERPQYSWQIGRGCHGVQGLLKQTWGLLRVWQAFEASGIEADVVVRMRPDLAFSVPPEPPALDDAIHVPTFANWWGINDRFLWGSRPVMQRFFTRLERLDEYVDAGNIFHHETFAAWSVAGTPIVRSRVVFASVRKNGSRDEPVWVNGTGDELPC
jgi:hypothetical protein